MNQSDIIRIAKEAGLDCAPDGHVYHPDTTDSAPLDVFVERLVHLAQAAEREECAKLCDLLMAKARGSDPKRSLVFLTAEGLASEIRARGEQMTQDDIIRMADKTKLTPVMEMFQSELEHFAKLVAAAEREECAKLCEAYVAPGIGKEMATAIRARGSK